MPDEPHPTVKAERMADQLMIEIDTGLRPYGTRLPGEPALAREFEVSRETARDALEILRNRGRVATRRGFGSWVREPHVVRELPADRYAAAAAHDVPLMRLRQNGLEGRQPGFTAVDTRDTILAASVPAALRDLLRLGPQEPVIKTVGAFYADGTPQHLVTTYLPRAPASAAALTDALPLAAAIRHGFEQAGFLFVSVREEWSARPPVAAEAKRLAMPTGVPLLICRWAMTFTDVATTKVVAVAEVLLPSDRTVVINDVR